MEERNHHNTQAAICMQEAKWRRAGTIANLGGKKPF